MTSATSQPEAPYSYKELLDRFYGFVTENNPTLGTERTGKIRMPVPDVVRIGSRKSGFTNFGEACRLMNRTEEHVFQFFLAELGTTGSIDSTGQLILRGRYGSQHMQTVLARYIKQYATCPMCRSLNTSFSRDQSSRLNLLVCENCGASQSIHAIRSGFRATTKGQRRGAIEAAS